MRYNGMRSPGCQDTLKCVLLFLWFDGTNSAGKRLVSLKSLYGYFGVTWQHCVQVYIRHTSSTISTSSSGSNNNNHHQMENCEENTKYIQQLKRPIARLCYIQRNKLTNLLANTHWLRWGRIQSQLDVFCCCCRCSRCCCCCVT